MLATLGKTTSAKNKPVANQAEVFSWFKWSSIDKILLMTTGAIIVLSLVMIYSASIDLNSRYEELNSDFFVKKHLLILLVSCLLFMFCIYFPMKFWHDRAPLIIVLSLALLILVLAIGAPINGAKRWINLGLLNFQPAEFAKLAIVIYGAYYVEKKIRNNITNKFWWAVAPMGFLVGFIAILLQYEPDLGSTIVIFCIAFVVLFMGGVRLTGILVIGLLAIGFFISVIYLSPWRVERVFAFLDPWSQEHALGKGYQLTHSLIAIGRGEITGVGLGLGVEKFNWLPEAHTDFIFAVIGEELGFIGIFIIVGLYWVLLVRIVKIGSIAIRRDDVFSGLVVFGIATWLALQSCFHMGVNLGLLPTKGITLPMMSYGGSGLILNLMALAIVLRVNFENQPNLYK